MKKAFTIVELLIVISIVGLFAAIVLVNMKGTQEKAKVTKLLDFSHTIQRGLGDSAAGIWGFNEGAGNTALDGSGYSNEGVINGASYTPNTPHSIAGISTGKYALHFNGNSDYVDVGDPTSGVLDFGTEDFTLEAWFYLDALPGAWKCIINKGASGNVGYGMEINNFNRLTASIQATGGTDQHVNSAASAVSAQKWHHAVAVFDRDQQINLYLDGEVVVSAAYSAGNAGSVDNATEFRVGRHLNNTRYFNGSLDEIKIYKKALSYSEVQKLYAKGLNIISSLAVR